jgi:hypothetical protein
MSRESVVAEWPSDHEFIALDRATGLVHVAREYEQPGLYDSIVEHSTWCGISVNRRSFALQDDSALLTCFACLSRSLYTWSPPGLHTNPCAEIPLGTAMTSGLAGDIVSVKLGR